MSGRQPITRWGITLGLCALLLWAASQASRGVRTGGVLLDTLQTLRIWGGVTSLPPLEDWQVKWSRLLAARDIEPGNPDIAESLGLLAARRLDDYSRLQESSAHYLRALELRPISANTWANLAQARYLVNDTSHLFETAIRNAARLGPSNPQVQRIVALYGLAVLDEIGSETRRAVQSMVAAGMRRDPVEMLSIAQRRGRLDLACRYLPEVRRKIDDARRVCAQAPR